MNLDNNDYENFRGKRRAKRAARRAVYVPPPPPPPPIFQAEEMATMDNNTVFPDPALLESYDGEDYDGDGYDNFLGLGKKGKARRAERKKNRTERRDMRRTNRKERKLNKRDRQRANTEGKRARNQLTLAKAHAKTVYADTGIADPDGAGNIIQGAAGIIGGIFGKGGGSQEDQSLGAAAGAMDAGGYLPGSSYTPSAERMQGDEGLDAGDDFQADPPAEPKKKNNNTVIIIAVVVVVLIIVAFLFKRKK